MIQACWFEHKEQGGFPLQRATVGDCDLSVLPLGLRRWSWLMRRAGVALAEGEAYSLVASQEAATEAAVRDRS